MVGRYCPPSKSWHYIIGCSRNKPVLTVCRSNFLVYCPPSATSALQLHLHFRPCADNVFNVLESLSLSSSLITVVLSTALLQYQAADGAIGGVTDTSMSTIEWVVTGVLVVLNIGTSVILITAWLWAQFTRVHKVLRARSTAWRVPKPTDLASLHSPPSGTFNPMYAGQSLQHLKVYLPDTAGPADRIGSTTEGAPGRKASQRRFGLPIRSQSRMKHVAVGDSHRHSDKTLLTS
jgi:hypothetical protein